MKKVLLASALVIALGIISFSFKMDHVEVYKVDTKLSTLEWHGKKIGGEHKGTISLISGVIKDNHGHIYGNMEFDMNTIANTDLKNENMKAKLENHLKSSDFFDVAKYPKASFVITSIMPAKDPKNPSISNTVKGNLTIKDKTNEISFGVALQMKQNKMTCTGTVIVDRSKFDVRYGSKTFNAAIGDKMIYDEFELKFNIVAVR
jgi:polyisoprenoid-binding protein YceI